MNLYQKIESVQGWESFAKKEHWKPGYSAMELAKAFFRHGTARVPAGLEGLLRSSVSLAGLVVDEVIPELTTELPPPGAAGRRNHDLWMRARSESSLVGIGVEAKVNEAFDRPIGERYAEALSKRADGTSTRFLERCEAIGRLVLGDSFRPDDPEVASLRYQLFSGVAGTLLQCAKEGRTTAVFAVYELVTAVSRDEDRLRNARDFKAFVGRLPGVDADAVSDGVLLGPIRYGGNEHLRTPVDLYIGKVSEAV